MTTEFEGKPRHCFDIMDDQHAALVGGPSLHGWIIGSGRTHVLNRHDVHAADAAQDAAHDVPIEILTQRDLLGAPT